MRSVSLIALFVLAASATQYYYTPANGSNGEWVSVFKSGLKAGDTLTFAAGTYNYNAKLSTTFVGTAGSPITIQGESGAAVQLNQNGNQNCMDIQGSYFTLRNLKITSSNDGIRGLRFGEVGNCDHVLVENCTISTSETAINANQGSFKYSYMTFRYNEIYGISGTGEGFYLGTNGGDAQFFNGVVEYNYIHDTTNPRGGSGAGVQIKTGSYNNTVRYNVVKNVNGPCYLTYDDNDLGVNYIYNNLCIKSNDLGIQVSAGAVIYNNIVVNSGQAGIGALANQLSANKNIRNVKIYHNTIINAGNAGIRINTPQDSDTFAIVNNFISGSSAFNVNGIVGSKSTVSGNLYTGSQGSSLTGSTKITDAKFQDATNYNYYPQDGSPLIGAGTSDASSVNNDYNCLSRSSTKPTVGAYEYSSTTNPVAINANYYRTSCGSGTPSAPPTTPPTTPTTPSSPPTTPTTPPTTPSASTGVKPSETTGSTPTSIASGASALFIPALLAIVALMF